jgi:cob(I)alamin adenosyltransferase
MGHRLSKIYTRTGDTGTTGLGDGSRVPKDSARIEALGAVDELNSCIGLLLTEPLAEDVRLQLIEIQHDLFDVGGALSIPGYETIRAEQVEQLERWLDGHNENLDPLKEFILPGGTRAAALTHLARTVARRAERRLIALASDQAIPSYSLQYLNRLSDLLFVLSRIVNRRAGRHDVLWRRDRGRPGQDSQ